MSTKEVQRTLVLGKLDKDTLLAANAHAFVIKERVKTKEGEQWVSRYFYSEILDALRGYVKHNLRSEKQLDGSIHSLISAIEKLDNTVRDVSSKVNADYTERIQDPIESHLMAHGE
jgi:hypothetical protein